MLSTLNTNVCGNTAYAAVIGAGSANPGSPQSTGVKGINSTLTIGSTVLTAVGGGIGAFQATAGPGGSGGGGAGYQPGDPGGSASGAGNGGHRAGAGGGLGAAGSTGTSGSAGAAGYYIKQNSNSVTWSATGTRSGSAQA